MTIHIQKIRKSFGAQEILHGIDLHIQTGELVALLGPSGCGKTTLLRLIAGLESPDSGDISFGSDSVVRVHARDRRVGFVFQHYALFGNLTVFENIAFGLRVKPRSQRPSESVIRDRVEGFLKLVQLPQLGRRFPAQLSGGQRQRVAPARALIMEPRVLLLDEPFGALDAKVRKELRRWVRQLQQSLKLTTVFVTHDQEEAFDVSDRIALMNAGQIVQSGSALELHDSPSNDFVHSFIGDSNRIRGQITGHAFRSAPWHYAVNAGASSAGESSEAAAAWARFRPHDVELQHFSRGVPVEKGLSARILRATPMGALVRVELLPIDASPQDVGADVLDAEIPRSDFDRLGLREGDLVSARLNRVRIVTASDTTAPRAQ